MKKEIKHMLTLWTMAALVLPWSSCNEEDDGQPTDTVPRPSVTLVTSIGGMGDNGYNDLILGSVMDFAQRQDVALSIVSPRDMEEARAVLSAYGDSPADGHRSLLILGSSDFAPLLENSLPALKQHRNILLLESDREELPEGVHTFSLRRYGAAFLCGLMAAECPEACVIAACPDEPTIQPAIEGFTQGYAQGSGRKATVAYLADDISGFNSTEEAYAVTKDLPWNAFIFPLAGGSASGIYKYVREDLFTGMLVAGMDVDCSAYSTRTPFSLTVDIDRVLSRWLDDWLQGKDVASHMEYGMVEGYVNVTVNPDFFDNCLVWEDYYDHPDYWQNTYNKSYASALEAERKYYEQ